ncbi:hypothetical protein GE061_002797 [Apolygus lucorum]|uniref:Uncharacterized protein n=1 Tax=Apolygus lucorum TaxID=248454 RepID=A0A6A4KHA6_APOLU|nr:hypothetical protein GE061_002797 [Apolygus lucorum]
MSRSDFAVISLVLLTGKLISLRSSFAQKAAEATTFPWFCIVIHETHFVSTCTIIRENYVIVSADNVAQKIPGTSRYFNQVVQRLVIKAGDEASKALHVDNYQVKTPKKLYVSRPEINEIFENPDNLRGQIVGQDLYGLAFSVGLLWFEDPFKWSEFVKPVPLFDSIADTTRQIEDFLGDTELELMDQKPCIVATWNPKTRLLEETEVIFIPDQSCREVFCAYDENACTTFPKRPYLMCFKSLNFRDMCLKDRGAALICNHFDGKAIGILTTAVSCGFKNVPGVYTSGKIVQQLLNKVIGG